MLSNSNSNSNSLQAEAYSHFLNKKYPQALHLYTEALKQPYLAPLTQLYLQTTIAIVYIHMNNYTQAHQMLQGLSQRIQTIVNSITSDNNTRSKNIPTKNNINVHTKIQNNNRNMELLPHLLIYLKIQSCLLILELANCNKSYIDMHLQNIFRVVCSARNFRDRATLFRSLLLMLIGYGSFQELYAEAQVKINSNIYNKNKEAILTSSTTSILLSSLSMALQLTNNPELAFQLQQRAFQTAKSQPQPQIIPMLISCRHIIHLCQKIKNKSVKNSYISEFDKLINMPQIYGISQQTLFRGYEEKIECGRVIVQKIWQFQQKQVKNYHKNNSAQYGHQIQEDIYLQWLHKKIVYRLQQILYNIQNNNQQQQASLDKNNPLSRQSLIRCLNCLNNPKNGIHMLSYMKDSDLVQLVLREQSNKINRLFNCLKIIGYGFAWKQLVMLPPRLDFQQTQQYNRENSYNYKFLKTTNTGLIGNRQKANQNKKNTTYEQYNKQQQYNKQRHSYSPKNITNKNYQSNPSNINYKTNPYPKYEDNQQQNYQHETQLHYYEDRSHRQKLQQSPYHQSFKTQRAKDVDGQIYQRQIERQKEIQIQREREKSRYQTLQRQRQLQRQRESLKQRQMRLRNQQIQLQQEKQKYQEFRLRQERLQRQKQDRNRNITPQQRDLSKQQSKFYTNLQRTQRSPKPRRKIQHISVIQKSTNPNNNRSISPKNPSTFTGTNANQNNFKFSRFKIGRTNNNQLNSKMIGNNMNNVYLDSQSSRFVNILSDMQHENQINLGGAKTENVDTLKNQISGSDKYKETKIGINSKIQRRQTKNTQLNPNTNIISQRNQTIDNNNVMSILKSQNSRIKNTYQQINKNNIANTDLSMNANNIEREVVYEKQVIKEKQTNLATNSNTNVNPHAHLNTNANLNTNTNTQNNYHYSQTPNNRQENNLQAGGFNNLNINRNPNPSSNNNTKINPNSLSPPPYNPQNSILNRSQQNVQFNNVDIIIQPAANPSNISNLSYVTTNLNNSNIRQNRNEGQSQFTNRNIIPDNLSNTSRINQNPLPVPVNNNSSINQNNIIHSPIKKTFSENQVKVFPKLTYDSPQIQKFMKLCCEGQYFDKKNFSSDGGSERFLQIFNNIIRWSVDQQTISSKFQSYKLKDIRGIVYGKVTQTFLKECNRKCKPWLCFSLILPKRTLDFCCRQEIDASIWLPGLSAALNGQILSLKYPKRKKKIPVSLFTPGKVLWKRFLMKLKQIYKKHKKVPGSKYPNAHAIVQWNKQFQKNKSKLQKQ